VVGAKVYQKNSRELLLGKQSITEENLRTGFWIFEFFSFPAYWSLAPELDMTPNDVVSGRADLIDNGVGEGDQTEVKAHDDAALLVSDSLSLSMHSTK
jgi:hypothetical protein